MAKKANKPKPKKTVGSKASRRLQPPSYKSFRLHKRIKHPTKLPGSFKLLRRSLGHLRRHWRLFGGIVLIYLLLTVVLVKGLGVGANNIPELKSILQELGSGGLGTGLSLFGLLVSNLGSASTEVAGAYQSLLLVIVSLVLIWAMRQTYADNPIRVRDAYYKGLYPLVPFILILLVLLLEFMPLAVANFLYGAIFSGGLAVTAAEQVVWAAGIFLLVLLTLYLITSSVFGLYIVTLPDMTPLKALRSARGLVRHRRWTVLRKILFLPLAMLVIAAIIMIPIILWLTPLTEWIFFVLSMAGLAVAQSYLYSLYRELL